MNHSTKRFLRIAGGLTGITLGGLAVATLLGCSTFDAPAYQGPRSDHYDGDEFYNEDQIDHGFWALLEWQLTAERGPWPEWIEVEPGPPPPRRVDRGELRITWVNHATLLIQTDGLNILTDPIWSKRSSPVSWAGPKRVRPPGIRFEDLPPVDIVLISHNHYDHLDVETVKRLEREHDPRFIVPLGLTRYLRELGVDGSGDLDWWQRVEVADGVWISVVPARHFSGRGMTDRNETLWAGFVVEGTRGPILFAGDTGFGPHFAEIRDEFGPIEVAMLPIGAYEPRWFMSPVHMNPAEAVRAHEILEASRSIGMHWGTFRLADDGYEQPMRELEAALADANPTQPGDFIVPEGGVGMDF